MAKYFTITVTKEKPLNTLWGIAEKYLGAGSRYPEIMKLNGLKSDVIHAGQSLMVYELPEEEKKPDVKEALNQCLSAIEDLPEYQKLVSLL